jgi:hypothetical protein
MSDGSRREFKREQLTARNDPVLSVDQSLGRPFPRLDTFGCHHD